MNKKGFTLIELLAVIAILVIILLIAVPKISDMINTSKKKTFLSSINMIQKDIKTDSLIFKSSNYTLDSNGILKRINGDEEVQIDYKGKLYSKDEAVISVGDDNAITLVSGEICDASKKYCIGSGSICNISSISMESLTLSNINEYSAGNYDDVLDEGDITKEGTSGSVTYKYCSNGAVVIDGTGDGLMKSEMYLFYNMLSEYFINQVSQKTGILSSDFNTDDKTIFTYYMNGYTKINDYSDWDYEVSDILGVIFKSNENFTDNLNAFLSAYDTLNITIPQINRVIINNGVKSISGYAFYPGEESLQDWEQGIYTIKIDELYLSNTVQTIGAYAFSNSSASIEQESNNFNNNIDNLDIPDSVTAIGNGAFSGCGIETLTLGAGLNTIEDHAFQYNNIESLIIPRNVATIGKYTFAKNKLNSLTFNQGIESIDQQAFEKNSLTSVTIPSSIVWIGMCAFIENRILAGNAVVIHDTPTGDINEYYLHALQVFLSNGINGDEDIWPIVRPQ